MHSVSPEIVFEDDDILVINKDPGMVVHPAPGHADNTIADWLRDKITNPGLFSDPLRPGIVHRLDKDTSGLLLLAKNPASEINLQKQFRKRRVHKQYHILVRGVIYQAAGSFEGAIGRSPVHFKKQCVSETEKSALTTYEVKERFTQSTWVIASPMTGRTHQLRVHFLHAGYPVLGDRQYGRSRDTDRNLYLCAAEISFTHPAHGQDMTFSIPLPDFFQKKINQLRIDTTGGYASP